MRKLTLIAAAGALAIGGAGIAVAKHHGSAKGGWDMARADANGDGLITLDEAKAHGAERFAKMDANNDGSISRADREARAQQRFIESDSNGDGELTPAEMTAAREKREAERAERRAQKRAERQTQVFAKLDTDGSGGLSQEELKAGKAMRSEMRGPQRGGERRAGRRGGAMRMLKRADTNNDQAVSRDEFNAMIEARFARVDTDGSGTISQSERDAAKAKFKRRSGPRGAGRGAGS